MRTLADLLREGTPLGPDDLAQITARAAGQLQYGHDLGSVHGDVGVDTLLVERQDGGWSVQLDQPRAPAGPNARPSDDVRDLGHVVDRLAREVPGSALPGTFPAALASMTSPDPGQRPTAAQVELYFGEDFEVLPGTTPAATPGTVPHQDDEEVGPSADADTTQVIPGYAVHGASGAALAAQGADGTWGDDDGLLPAFQDEDPDAERDRPRRSGRAAVVVSAVVLLLGVGSLGYVVWRALGPEPDPRASVSESGPTDDDGAAAAEDPPAPSDEAETEDSGADDDEVAGDADPTEDEPSTDGTADDPAGTDSGTEDGEADETDEAGEYDHTDPQWAAGGWDTQALDDAYCRDGSEFVGLAETDAYRGVICNGGWGYSYRGLNKHANATLHSTADATDDGWEAYGEGGVVYRFDEETFTILDGDGDVLDEEPVEVWLTPDQEPFRPGDLDLSQPISYPDCDGSGVVVLASLLDPATNAETVQAALDEHPGSFYVRTDLSCDNFNRPSLETRSSGNYIYSVLVYGGDTESSLCDSIESYGAYGYFLREGVEPGQPVQCD